MFSVLCAAKLNVLRNWSGCLSPGGPDVELRRGGLPGGAVREQPAPHGGLRPGGGRLRAPAGGQHRPLGGQEPPAER